MAPSWVVPTLDPGEQGCSRLGLALPTAPVDQLAFEAGEEALGHGVVIGVPDRSRRGPHAHFAATAAKGDAGVLAALVGVMDDHWQCFAPSDRTHATAARAFCRRGP